MNGEGDGGSLRMTAAASTEDECGRGHMGIINDIETVPVLYSGPA